MVKTKKDIIHVGIGYSEAIQGKREVLLSEGSLLKIIKSMRAYSELRKREFILKNRIKKDLSSVKILIKEVEEELPEKGEIDMPMKKKPKLPEFDVDIKELKRIQEKEIEKEEIKKLQKTKNREIEEELEEISRKLAQLS